MIVCELQGICQIEGAQYAFRRKDYVQEPVSLLLDPNPIVSISVFLTRDL